MISYEIGSGMRYLSVCDGIGAVHLAWQPLGWRCVGISEIAPFPAAVVEHHYGFDNLGDMTGFREWPETLLADVDLLVGGTPCQSFSVGGHRRSLDDKRGILTLDYVNLFHLINEKRKRHGRPPAIAVWENVPGVLKTKDNAFGCLLGGLLGENEAPRPEEWNGKWGEGGFLRSETVRVGWKVLDAHDFAVAQRRRRVFLVAVPCELAEHFGDRACPSRILSLPEGVPGNPPTREAERQETPESVGSRPARGAATGEAERPDFGACDRVAFHHGAEGRRLPSRARGTNGGAVVVGTREVVGTLTTREGSGFKRDGTPAEGLVIHDGRVRYPTLRERERLQGFPDDYTAITFKGKPAPKTARIRAIGNSIAVPILRWLGVRIAEAFTMDGPAQPGRPSQK